MIAQFRKKNIEIAKIFHCPHHPDFTGECDCRKPKPGMILQAINEFNLNPQECILIGDKKRDIQAGKNAGIAKNLLIQDIFDEVNSD